MTTTKKKGRQVWLARARSTGIECVLLVSSCGLFVSLLLHDASVGRAATGIFLRVLTLLIHLVVGAFFSTFA